MERSCDLSDIQAFKVTQNEGYVFFSNHDTSNILFSDVVHMLVARNDLSLSAKPN